MALVGKFRILASRCIEAYLWHTLKELSKLVEKRARKIKILSIIKSVLLVSPPVILVKNFERFIRRVNRNYIFSSGIARTFVKVSLVTSWEDILCSTIGTKYGWRDDVFFYSPFNFPSMRRTRKGRTYFFVKLQIFICDGKRERAMSA